MQFADALRARKSVRAFKSDPVPRELVVAILEDAARAPSGQGREGQAGGAAGEGFHESSF